MDKTKFAEISETPSNIKKSAKWTRRLGQQWFQEISMICHGETAIIRLHLLLGEI